MLIWMDMAPSADSVDNNDICNQAGIQCNCTYIDGNVLLGIQSALTAAEATNSSSFAASNTKIAATSSNHKQVAVSALTSPSYARFRRFFRKVKHALCELM
jgi:hypothetical protein